MLMVTGATGFIGQHLMGMVPEACAVIRRSSEHSFTNFFTIDDLDENTCWDGAFDGIDSIIHLAALAHSRKFNKLDFFKVNVQGTINLAKQAAEAGVKRFVFVSSIGVLGGGTSSHSYHSGSQVQPHTEYAESKYLAEEQLIELGMSTGLEVVIVRPTLVYGANAPGNFGMLTKIIEKLPMLPFGAADNKRDFIAVQNLCDLLVTCATHPNADGHTFLASDGETVSTKEFTNAIAEGLGKKVIQLPIPTSLMRLAGRLIGKSTMIEQLFGNLEVDSSNAKDVLGWRPSLNMKQAMATLRSSGNNK
ncbi:NAD-dependent epimerase/dehydratase family protein [Vibrio alginolyticus]|nr:NAD-dependent epimerase/dehydratase family protein [Vibrio alginolyticus]